MSLFSVARSFMNPASLLKLAMGPAGWASLATKTLGSVIGQQVLQKLGQLIGMPQGIIDLTKSSLAAATGTKGFPTTINGAVADLGKKFNLSPMQQGQLTRAITNDVNKMVEILGESFKSGKNMAETRKSQDGKKSWLQAIADSMATILDAKIEDMDRMSKALQEENSKAIAFENKNEGKRYDTKSIKSSTDLQVAGQEFGYLMSATSTVVKTIGEGLSTMARKQ